MSSGKVCRVCKIELIPDENWAACKVKKKDQICRDCNLRLRREEAKRKNPNFKTKTNLHLATERFCVKCLEPLIVGINIPQCRIDHSHFVCTKCQLTKEQLMEKKSEQIKANLAAGTTVKKDRYENFLVQTLKDHGNSIIELFNNGIGSRKTAEILAIPGVTRYTVKTLWKRLGLDRHGKKPKTAYLAKEKKCSFCGEIKPTTEFYHTIAGDPTSPYSKVCKSCNTEACKSYVDKNRDKVLQKQAEYRAAHKEEQTVINREYIQNRKAIDPVFKLRKEISSRVASWLKKQGGSKDRDSILNHLPYEMLELKRHIEKLFSHPDNIYKGTVWMNWKNQGVYSAKDWDDNDVSTFRWQLDHIIPLCTLPHKTLDEPNFVMAWGLDNLRPLSAKQNSIDRFGNRTTDDIGMIKASIRKFLDAAGAMNEDGEDNDNNGNDNE